MQARYLVASITALALASGPAIAQDSAAGRASLPSSDDSEMSGSGTILAILAVAAIVAGLLIAFGGGDDDSLSA